MGAKDQNGEHRDVKISMFETSVLAKKSKNTYGRVMKTAKKAVKQSPEKVNQQGMSKTIDVEKNEAQAMESTKQKILELNREIKQRQK